MSGARDEKQGERTDPELTGRLLTALSKAGQVLRSQQWGSLHGRHLTPTQAQILTVLAAARGEEKRLADVAEALGVSAPTASEAVATLARKKLVRRTPAAADRRATALALTPQGEHAAERAAAWPEPVLAALEPFEPRELALLLAGLVRLLRAFEAARLIPTVRMCPSCANFRKHAHADPARPHHCELLDAAIADRDVRFDCAFHARSGAPAS